MKSFHFIHAIVRLIPIHFPRSTILRVPNPEANQALPGVTAVLGHQKSGSAQSKIFLHQILAVQVLQAEVNRLVLAMIITSIQTYPALIHCAHQP
jgi:hypothetical protein